MTPNGLIMLLKSGLTVSTFPPEYFIFLSYLDLFIYFRKFLGTTLDWWWYIDFFHEETVTYFHSIKRTDLEVISAASWLSFLGWRNLSGVRCCPEIIWVYQCKFLPCSCNNFTKCIRKIVNGKNCAFAWWSCWKFTQCKWCGEFITLWQW